MTLLILLEKKNVTHQTDTESRMKNYMDGSWVLRNQWSQKDNQNEQYHTNHISFFDR